MSVVLSRWSLTLAALLVLSAASGGADPAGPKAQDIRGKVQPLASVLEKYGVKMDAEAAAQAMALVGDDGKVYPLLKDESSRMFFKDPALLNRPMQLTGRVLEGSFLQVLEVHSIVKGQLCDVYYWCDVCSIRRMEKKNCECCGEVMVLKEVPVKK